MPQSVPTIDPRETLPMTVKNMTFMIERLHRDCSPLQFVRELTQNSIEAIQGLADRKGEIIWDVDWNRYDLTKVYKLAIVDTGIGMTGEDMVGYINSLSASIHQQSIEGNFGVGAKVAAVPRNHAGLIYLSWQNGLGSMVHVWRDPDTGVYGLRRFERPDGSADYWTVVDNAIKPQHIGDHGTMVILLGNDPEENTLQAPVGTPMPSRWILRYLNSRYFRFPKNIAVKSREGWELPKGDSHNFFRTVTGMNPWLDKNRTEKGTVQLSGATARWWILNENLDLDAGHYTSGGHIAALHNDELYEITAGRAGVSRLQTFGAIFGHQRLVIYVEPKNEGQNTVVSNTARTNLLVNGEPLPWVEWAAEFREAMPDAIKKLIEEVAASSVGQDHRSSIRERLKQILDLFRVSRYRPVATSATMAEDVPGAGGVPRAGNGSRGDGGQGKTGRTGGRAGDIYALFQTPTGNPAEEVHSLIADPKVQWVSVQDRTRTPPDLEDRAGKYLPQQHLIIINGDFRVFTDMVERWSKKYSHAPGARPVVESIVREWFEQQLIEAVMGALALRGSNQWTMQDFEKLWSEEGLTAVVLPRYHIDQNVKRALGARLGSLRDYAA